jgi:hypothetical protein
VLYANKDRAMSRPILISLAVFAISTPACAITCHGDFQVVNGEEISTPYCRDNAVAAVAREYGYHVSDKTVRNEPARKEERCRYLRSDIRVHPACNEVLPDGGRH